MPTYKYNCAKCTHSWEETRAIDQRRAGVVCPKCETPDPEIVLGRTQMHLKGSGWARDGYRK